MALVFACGGRGSSGSSMASGASEGTDVSDNGEIKFMLDGVQWVSGPPGHPEMNFEEEAITDGNTMVRIEGFAADGSRLAITIYRALGIGTGTYPITDQGMQGYFEEEANSDSFLTNGMKDNPGSVTITKLTDDKVQGTFRFAIRSAGDPEDIRQITNGSFDLSFTKY